MGKGTVIVKIVGDAKGLTGALNDAQGALGGFGGAVVKAGAAAGVAIAGAAVAFGASSLKAFSGFEQQMNEVFTLLPDISGDAMAKMDDQVKGFAREFGVLPDKVVPALYQALSAGVPQDNVFDFLETAQKAAKGGVTDLTTAVDGISSVVNAYGADVLSAAKASDLMFTAVRLGKTNFEELSGALYNVTPTASALGVKFEDITAALAAMTAQGVPTSVATTQLRQLLVEVSKEGTKTSDLFEKLAKRSFKDFVASGGNVQSALQLLEAHAHKSNIGVNDLFGSVEAGGAALALTGRGTEAFTKALGEMGNATGATEAAFATMDKGIGASFDKIRAGFETFKLELGERLAPFVSTAIEFLTDTFRKLQPVLRDLGEYFHTRVVPVLRETAGEVKASLLPVLDQVRTKFEENKPEIMAVIAGLQTLAKFVLEEVTPVLMHFSGVVIRNQLEGLAVLIDALGEGVRAFEAFVNGVIRQVNRVIDGINLLKPGADIRRLTEVSFIGSGSGAPRPGQGGRGGGPVFAAAAGFDGMVTGPTMFLAGEAGPERVSIVPASRLGAGGGPGGTLVLEVPVVVDGREIARSTVRYTWDELRRLAQRNAGRLALEG